MCVLLAGLANNHPLKVVSPKVIDIELGLHLRGALLSGVCFLIRHHCAACVGCRYMCVIELLFIAQTFVALLLALKHCLYQHMTLLWHC